MIDRQAILHSPFDMKTHKDNFINYLEVVILEDGTIEYAVPSHYKKLEKICCKKLGLKYDELYNESQGLLDHYESIYRSYINYWNDWLLGISGAIMVWNDRYVGIANEKQLQRLKELKDYGLYFGEMEHDN